MEKNQILLTALVFSLFFCNGINSFGSSDIGIVSFSFQRNVFRAGVEIPVTLKIWNNNLNDVEVNVEIKLADNLYISKGTKTAQITLPMLAYTDLNWTVIGSKSGAISAELVVIAGVGDTIKTKIYGTVTDTYWTKDDVVSLNFLRTVLKPGEEIPVFAKIWNNNLEDIEAIIKLKLADNLTLSEGAQTVKIRLPKLAFTELNWSVLGASVGKTSVEVLAIAGVDDTLKAQTDGIITDKYWKQKEFLISAWSPPPTIQAALDYYKGANFDLDLVIHNTPFSSEVSMLKKNNMNGYIQISEVIPNYWIKLKGDATVPSSEITNADLKAMDPVINAYINEKSVLGYHLIDEPGATRFKNVGKVVSYLKEKDPAKLSYINVFGNTAEPWQMDAPTYYNYIFRYLSEVKPEMLSFDNYHFYTTYDGDFYFKSLETIRELALKFKVPYTNIIQLIGTEEKYFPTGPRFNWRTPTPSEHRFLVYASLTYGFTGIVWFHWQMTWGFTGYPADKKAEIYGTVSQLNKEMRNIGDEMLKLKSVGVFHLNNIPTGTKNLPVDQIVTGISGKEYIIGLFKDSIQSDYFMIMNKDYKANTQATISLKNQLAKLEYFNANTDTWVNISDYTLTDSGSRFTLPITAGNGILFRPTWIFTGVGEIAKTANNNILNNYPNPFSFITTIKYGVSQDGEIELYVTNLLGEKITVLEKTFRKKGVYTLNFDASNYSSGIYFYSLKSKNSTQTKQMILSH